MNIAMIGAHQDDEVFCIGTLLKYRSQKKHRFSFIYLTNGDKGISDDPRSDYARTAKLRATEAAGVAGEFNATLDILPNADEALFDSWENRLAVLECIRRHKIDLIFTHYTSEYNLDHNITSAIVFQAALLANVASVRTPSRALRKPPAIFYMNPGEGYGFEGTHFVEIPTPLARQVNRVMRHHRSQIAVFRRAFGGDLRMMFIKRMQSTGARVGVKYAEVFRPCLADRRTPLSNLLP